MDLLKLNIPRCNIKNARNSKEFLINKIARNEIIFKKWVLKYKVGCVFKTQVCGNTSVLRILDTNYDYPFFNICVEKINDLS